MKTALVMSSIVAASRVGASASSFCLRRLGVETVTLPTTLFGRHPGWGTPGGGPVDVETLRDMWRSGIAAQNMTFDAVLTGYMASPAHIDLAVEIIAAVKAKNPAAIILVDPVMGDNGNLYIKETIAQDIKSRLVPLASFITPNVWELGYLTGLPVTSTADILQAARTAHAGTIVTSIPDGGKIGAAYVHEGTAALVSHEKFASTPHGGGDALAATLLAHKLSGLSTEDALAKAVAGIFDMISTAIQEDAGELPLVRRQAALSEAQPLPMKRVKL